MKDFSCEELEKMYNDMMEGLENNKPCSSEVKRFNHWLEDLQASLMNTVSDALKKLPDDCKEGGFGEATMTGIARFVCTFLEKMQRNGFVSEGVDLYNVFTEVLLPVCHKIVVHEMDEMEKLKEDLTTGTAAILFHALKDETLTEEEIFDKYLGEPFEAVREIYLNEFRAMRAEMKRQKNAN